MAKSSKKSVKENIHSLAMELGFDVCKFTNAQLPTQTSQNLKQFIELDRHGEMSWMEETLERRQQPTSMWPEAKSAIVLGLNYGPDTNPLEALEQKDCGTISVYAQNRDYHDLIKGRLKQIAQRLASKFECNVKVFVDTAPLMEKPLAQQAGLGWQGKHTNLVSRDLGSWLFLGTILTDLNIDTDESEIDHCGNCTSCLDICPTKAFPNAYQIDARRCISYLTIEYHGIIPMEFRKPMGNRIYGCDDCLAVCPWNKFAQTSSEIKLTARDDLKAPLLSEFLDLDDGEFRKHFSGSPIKRIGRNQFIRNVLIASGNSDNDGLIVSIQKHLLSDDPVIRATAIWALGELMSDQDFNSLKASHMPKEVDEKVKMEWLS